MKLPRTSARYVWFWLTHQYRIAGNYRRCASSAHSPAATMTSTGRESTGKSRRIAAAVP